MPLSDLVPGEFLLRAERAKALLDRAARVRILCHYDPDGTTSAAILARACLRRGLEFPAVVLDHHQVLRDSDKVLHLNPLLWGVDGAHGACGASVSFLYALVLDEANWDLAGVALAGR